MPRPTLGTRPKWTQLPDRTWQVVGEAYDIRSDNVLATSHPVTVSEDVLSDAEAQGPGVDRLIQGVEMAVQSMAREMAIAGYR
jgi:hypothetical protein